MNILKLYPSTATSFTNNGLGGLSDAISAKVTEELNGVFELEMTYPIDGIHFSDIALRTLITAKANPTGTPQPFRVYRITKPLNGIVTIYARHIAYDMAGIAVSPFEASSLGDAISKIPTYCVPTSPPFTLTTDKSSSTGFTVSTPTKLWSLIGGTEGSLLDTYGGEWEFDVYSAYLKSSRGQNRGVSIRYGKNLTSLEQDSNCANVYTAVYPYWFGTNATEPVTLTEKTISVSGTFDYTKVLPLDLTESFDTAPTEAQLRTRANKYITDNNIGVPDVSWTVGFAMLEQSEEYAGKALLERVYMGDTVTVYFEKLGINASARVVAIAYNPVLDRYDSVTLGKVKANLAETIVTQQQTIDDKPSKSLVSTISSQIAKSILGALGGCVRLLDTNNDGTPDELYIADNADPTLAQKVWRWNYQGWAASKTGYTGPYTMGATLDGGLQADFVTAAHLVAGSIASADGVSFYLNLDENVMRMAAVSNLETSLTASIATSEQSAKSYADSAVSAEASNTDTKIAASTADVDSKIANAKDGIDDKIDAVESRVNEKLIPLAEITDYIQVGNIGTAASPLFGVKIGKKDLETAFKSVFTANALEFYENSVKTAFLSNQKLNTNTIRTAAMELVASANMGDASSVDWLVTLDNGYTIKYVGGDS